VPPFPPFLKVRGVVPPSCTPVPAPLNRTDWYKIVIKMVWKQFVVIGVDGFTY